MAKISISEAAKLAGISRTHLYKGYINTGKLSTATNDQGKRCIETSELSRVFPSLQKVTTNTTQADSKDTPGLAVLAEKVKGLENLLEAREEELLGYKEREKTFYRLLEHQKPKKSRWWPF